MTWVTAAKGLLALLTLIINALLTRLLSPDEVGAYFIVLSLVSAFALISQAGINQAIVRLIAEKNAADEPSQARAIIRSSYLLVAFFTLLTAGVFLGGLCEWLVNRVFHFTLTGTMQLLATAWIVLLTFRSLLAETFRGLLDIKHATLFEGLLDSILLALMLAALHVLHGSGELQQVFVLAIFAGGLNTAVAAVVLKTRLNDIAGTRAHAPAMNILSTAWPMWVTGITFFLLGKADLWILGIFRSMDEVGLYGAVARLVTLVSVTLMIANSVIPPLVAEMNTRGNVEIMERTLRAIATVTSIPAFFALIIFVFWAGPILGLIYGDFYTTGALILITLSIGQFVNVWCGSCGSVLLMSGHQVLMMKITMACGTLTVVMASLLAAEFGGTGVAASVSLGIILQNLLMLASVKKYIGIWTHIDPRLIWRHIPGQRS